MPSSTRKFTLVVYSSRLFPAHWGLFVPSEANPNIGTLIHAVGDAKTGFKTEFKRNYNLGNTTRSNQKIVLDDVKGEFVVDSPANAPSSLDQTPKDKIERVALNIPPPGPSLQDSKAEGARKRTEIKNCQTWTKDVVKALAVEGILTNEAVEKIEKAPKN